MNVAFLYITPLIYVLYPTVISSSWFFFKHSTGLSILLSIKCTHCTRIIVLNGTYHTAAFKNLIVFCFRTFRVFSKCTRCTFLKHYRILISSIDVPDPVSRVQSCFLDDISHYKSCGQFHSKLLFSLDSLFSVITSALIALEMIYSMFMTPQWLHM